MTDTSDADSDTSEPFEPTTTADLPAPSAPTVEQLQAELAKIRAEARKHEQRAKTNEEKAKAASSAAQELERLKRDQMSEHEKAVAAAKAEGVSEAKRQFAGPMVAMALRAAAAGRLPDEVVDRLAATVNADIFLTDDGNVNMDAVSEFVNGLVPAAEEPKVDARFPELAGQGARSDPAGLNSNSLLDAFNAAVGNK